MTIFGWDASNWDDPPTQRDGIDFYTHKAAEGHHFYYDAEYPSSMLNARNLGVPILGAYYVNHPGTVDDQVDWFIEILNRDTPWWREHPCFILQIDAEKFDYMSREPNLQEIQAFGDRLVNKYGVNPHRVIAYAPQWLYGNNLGGLTYTLWASAYGSNPYVHYPIAYPGDSSSRWQAYSGQTPLFLQYGSNTTIGNQTTCDANAYRGTLQQLLDYFGSDDDMPAKVCLTHDSNGDTILMYPANGTWRRIPKTLIDQNKWVLQNALDALAKAGVTVDNTWANNAYDFSDPMTIASWGYEIKECESDQHTPDKSHTHDTPAGTTGPNKPAE